MNKRFEVEGREFDWFAIDNNGEIAMFSSAGYGLIPDSVIEHFHDYDDVALTFETPNFGTTAIWDDYAKYGIYVFDWKIYDGPYVRVAKPSKVITVELKNTIMSIKGLPRLNVEFSKLDELFVDI